MALGWLLHEAQRDLARMGEALSRGAGAGMDSTEEFTALVSLGRYAECILESMTSGVLVVDTVGRITLVNKEAAMVLDQPAESLVGTMLLDHTNLRELFRLINHVRSSRPLYERSNQQYEVEIEDFLGKRIPLGVSVNALLDDSQAVLGYVAICKDLSERKQLEATVERAERLSALGTMASGVAHNFNNILAAVLGRVQLMLRYPGRVDMQAGLETIQKSALDGAATVKRLQDFARVRVAGGDFEAVDLNEVVRDAVEYSRTRWDQQAHQDGVTYEVVPALCMDGQVQGLGSELKEVVLNLINNALDAMPDGGRIDLETSVRDDQVWLEVRDSGEGMSEDVRRRVFDPFFTTKGTAGMGLGLAESYGIVKRHRGAIEVRSSPGNGTTFTLRFPQSQASARKIEPSTPSKDGARPKGAILVVDDQRDQGLVLAEMLEPEGHEVRFAEGGKEGLEVLRSGRFDVLMTDLSMPEISGWDLARLARAEDPQLKIVLVTGLGASFDDERLVAAGVDRCLAKPVAMQQLLETVGELLRDQRQARESAEAPGPEGDPASSTPPAEVGETEPGEREASPDGPEVVAEAASRG